VIPNLDRLRDFAKSYTAAWCSQDAASVAAHYAPQGSLTINNGAPAVGRAAITDAAQTFMTAFPDLRVHMDDLVIEGDSAFYHWTLAGTNTGPGGTGQQVRISGFEKWKVNTEGLIAESQGQFDAVTYEHQLKHGCGTNSL
jgi:ketosteroid isomerase-like protein